MRRIGQRLALAVGSAVLLWAVPAPAQGIGNSYRYPTPALSPWFNLYNRQGGPVDNYNMFVQPDIQLRNTLQAQQFYNQRQAANATVLDHQVSQLEQNRLGVQATGAPSGFQNQGRYFGVTSVDGQRSFGTVTGPRSGHPAAGSARGNFPQAAAIAH